MGNIDHEISDQLQSQFLALYCMVVADGIIDVKELEALYRIGEEQYGLSSQEINQAVLSGGTSFVVPESVEAKIRFLFNLATIAMADGNLDSTEKTLLQKYIVRVGFMPENSEEIGDFFVDCVREGKSIEETILMAQSK